MPRCIVKQPNGKFAIWSSIVDDFVLLDATADEAIQDEMSDPHKKNYPGGKGALHRDLHRELANIETTGRAWKWSPTWDEAIATIAQLHGQEVADERVRDANTELQDVSEAVSTSPNFFCGPGGVQQPAGPVVVELFTKIERPEDPGWYWFRWSRDNHEWICVEVIRDKNGHYWAKASNYHNDVNDIENMTDGEWRGPIPMPPR